MSDTTPQPEDGFYVLVTGANSGLGFAICCRLIDEFLHTRPQSQTLVLIITTRDTRKGTDTVARLQKHLQNVRRKAERSFLGISMLLHRRIQFRQEILDLTSISSVQRHAERLLNSTPKLNAAILNAGIGGWEGLDWLTAIYTLLTDWVHAVTYPSYKVSGVGWLTKPQIPASGNTEKPEEPPLGEVFCANVFGHYLLCHYLAPLLSAHKADEGTVGRIIWTSSLEAYAHTFSLHDFQGLASSMPYEASKRLTDILALTAELPSTAPFVARYLSSNRPLSVSKSKSSMSNANKNTIKPKIYLTHPGICSTGIMPLHHLLTYLMTLAFYIARWLGSQWHGVTAWNGACAPAWVALAQQNTLDAMEEREGKGKWGSATDWWGKERVERTEVEGWGWGGVVGERIRKKGRRRGVKDLTERDRKQFEELGRDCWKEMEQLREEWEARLAAARVGEDLG
ncbi:3-keto-steroid reductase [Glonium stellatum]|uniref:3-keto-steroid reductase n=1 Tax=Glonium stellatum TaxID=574774 RepID=A0A8E2JS30_9PEZI|nr:3-keto-steroid reductase [Glonium stellatum]